MPLYKVKAKHYANFCVVFLLITYKGIFPAIVFKIPLVVPEIFALL
jgi:hypothetical protein